MSFFIESAGAPAARQVWLVTQADLPRWLGEQDPATRTWLEATGFKAERLQVALIPATDGSIRGAALGLGNLASVDHIDLWHTAALPDRLPGAGGQPWRIATPLTKQAATSAALGWAYGSYRFEAYKRPHAAGLERPALHPPDGADLGHVERTARATGMARDFINTPACDMTPARLAAEALDLARRNGVTAAEVLGETLQRDYPSIHAVGQASSCQPRLVDFAWGDATHPKLTIVGKGVCFDSGGLDIKPSAGMLLMKKDMGGAACALALARLVMESRLPVRLRVLIPAVENAIGGERVSTRRRHPHAQGPHGRGRQYGRRGPAGALRCDCGGRRGAAGPHDRPGDADGCGTRRARA